MERIQDTGIGSMALTERKGEMGIAAMAAKAKAEVEAKYVIAFNRPRKIMEARSAILDACKREKFAEAARYKKPVGKKQVNGKWEQQYIEGFSIRFAEVAIQAMKNITVETSIVWEDEDKRTVHVSVTDLESNLCYGEDITIAKTVERRSLKDGQEKLAERLNSYGDKVFIVAATDDEVANKVAAQRSKVIRNSGLRLIPQDFLEEASDAIMLTLEKGGTDPKAEVKKIVDAFHGIGVGSGELEKYLAHSLDTISKKELIDLRAVYSAVKDGEASWADYVSGEQNVPRAEAVPGPASAKAPFRRNAVTTAATPPANVVVMPDKDDGDLGPRAASNPTTAAAKEPSASTAAQPSQESTAANTASAEPKPADNKAPAPIPDAKTPSDWLPTLSTSEGDEVLKSVLKSVREWLGFEGITDDELTLFARGRGLAKVTQNWHELQLNKLVSILKQRAAVRLEILNAREAK